MYHLVIQLATDKTLVPKRSFLRKWAQCALSKKIASAEVTIRIVDVAEMTALNSTYRHKTGPTNVLSFPFSIPDGVDIEIPILGDIVICADVVNREAQEQGKEQETHWAHMIVHGIFHLLGYDHETDEDAAVMEALEIDVMQTLGFANPYETGEVENIMSDSPEDKPSNKNRSWLERLTAIIAREPQNREQLKEMLRDAEDRDVLSAEMLEMIERILQVSEMQVREVMVPKAQMMVVEKNSKLEDILPIVIESGHSRFPVLDPASNDIIGILLAKDILPYCFNKKTDQFTMSGVIRAAIFTPQSKRLDILLREFRVNRNHIAIVLDEYGHVAGLVTIEDVLEQIVGEIEDEYDIDEEDGYIKKHDNDVYIVKAQTPIDEFNEYFHSTFSEEEFDTIGGIVLQSFGHLPKRGESIKIKHWRFKVLHSDNRRIYLLEVRVVKKKVDESEG